jgi:kynurenine formamidase
VHEHRGVEVADNIRELAAVHASSHSDRCLGTVEHIDRAARLRGSASVVSGDCISLARDVIAGQTARGDEARPSVSIEVHLHHNGDLVIGTDRVELDAHGLANTHIDALAHVGVDGAWHGGVSSESVHHDDSSLLSWARHGLVTRGVLLDVPALRGVPYVDNGQPVSGAELEACARRAGVTIEPGDAVLVYMGRDRWEAEGKAIQPISEAHDGRPGLGPDAATWIADSRLSILCWDMLDAHGHGVDTLGIHVLIWAIGLALVDNCELHLAAEALRDRQPVGQLVVAPLAMPRATGCLVNPLLVV